MAKKLPPAAQNGSAEHVSSQDVQLANITTAASSTMGAADFSQGYQANEGALHNKNYTGGGGPVGGRK